VEKSIRKSLVSCRKAECFVVVDYDYDDDDDLVFHKEKLRIIYRRNILSFLST
jgi:hypothetical protein